MKNRIKIGEGAEIIAKIQERERKLTQIRRYEFLEMERDFVLCF